MKLRTFAFTIVTACSLFACEQLTDKISDVLPELTLSKEDGIPAVAGSTNFALPQDFKCGNPIADPNNKYTITTSGEASACTFTFDQDVVVLEASEYASRPELKGATFVKRVDMDVNKLGVSDGASQKVAPIDLKGTAFGAKILGLEDLAKAPPFTKSIEGAPIDALKAKVEKKQDIVIPIQVVIVVNLVKTPLENVALDFDAQPNLVFGF